MTNGQLHYATDGDQLILCLDFGGKRIAKRLVDGDQWTVIDRRFRIFGGLPGDRFLHVRPVRGGWTATVDRQNEETYRPQDAGKVL
jgi:hypothetical protein